MEFDITWTITAIIAVSSFLSPIFVALINNHHNAKMRKIELEYNACLRKMDLMQENITRQSDIYYSDKKQAFRDFLQAIGNYGGNKEDLDTYGQLLSSANTALLFCSKENKTNIRDFLTYVDLSTLGSGYSSEILLEYNSKAMNLAESLSTELESSKPITNCADCDTGK